MAASLEGDEYVVTGSAASISTILGLTGAKRFVSHATFRAGDANTGIIYIGKSDVTTAANRCGYLKVNESFSFGLENAFANLDEWFVVGSVPGDILHITMLA